MRARRQVAVAIPDNLLRGFRRRAKAIWPKEAYGILLGSRDGTEYHIEDIHYPSGWECRAREDTVLVTEAWWSEADIAAKRRGLAILGDIHSHSYQDSQPVRDCAPSAQDHDRFDEQYVQGIMAITKTKKGLRSTFRFWISAVSVSTVILR